MFKSITSTCAFLSCAVSPLHSSPHPHQLVASTAEGACVNLNHVVQGRFGVLLLQGGGLVSPGEMDLVLRILDQYCFSAGFLMSVQQGL